MFMHTRRHLEERILKRIVRQNGVRGVDDDGVVVVHGEPPTGAAGTLFTATGSVMSWGPPLVAHHPTVNLVSVLQIFSLPANQDHDPGQQNKTKNIIPTPLSQHQNYFESMIPKVANPRSSDLLDRPSFLKKKKDHVARFQKKP